MLPPCVLLLLPSLLLPRFVLRLPRAKRPVQPRRSRSSRVRASPSTVRHEEAADRCVRPRPAVFLGRPSGGSAPSAKTAAVKNVRQPRSGALPLWGIGRSGEGRWVGGVAIGVPCGPVFFFSFLRFSPCSCARCALNLFVSPVSFLWCCHVRSLWFGPLLRPRVVPRCPVARPRGLPCVPRSVRFVPCPRLRWLAPRLAWLVAVVPRVRALGFVPLHSAAGLVPHPAGRLPPLARCVVCRCSGAGFSLLRIRLFDLAISRLSDRLNQAE
jgi:hypothetical protein